RSRVDPGASAAAAAPADGSLRIVPARPAVRFPPTGRGRSVRRMTVIQEIPLTTIDQRAATLGDYAGTVLLVVNVASKCGLTPQYEALEKVHERYRDQGFSVVGFPANDFGAQEPGTDEEIVEFCSTN